MRWLLSIVLLLSTPGCSFSSEGANCLVDEDCAEGTICSQRAGCVQGTRDTNQLDAGMSSTAPDAALVDLNSSMSDTAEMMPDMSERDMPATHGDMSETMPDTMSDMSETDPSLPSQCIIDPFDVMCSDDANEPNGDFASATSIGPTGGCTFDGFVTTDRTSAGELCRGDQDWFRQAFIQCEGHSLILEAIARPLSACAHSDWSLRISGEPCAATNVQCENRTDGTKRVTVIYPVARPANIRDAEIVVEAGTNVKLPYELQVKVR